MVFCCGKLLFVLCFAVVIFAYWSVNPLIKNYWSAGVKVREPLF